MRCPHCNCGHNSVTHTWKRTVRWRGKPRTHIRRRRVCRHCGLSFSTVETMEDEDRLGYPEPDTVPEPPPDDTAPPPNPFT